MCGIVGALTFDQSDFPITADYLTPMRDIMHHRGPDGAGLWIADDFRVGLGHRRLSIIDLSEVANQPMGNEDGSVWVVFNGEIYNHAEIRAELEQAGGHCWKTDHSDTEVIVHGFETWGIEFIQRLRGMFAIAIWDSRERELWLIRDRVGIKPLYYSVHHGRLTFASEIKALLQDPQQGRAVNEEGFFHYLSFLTTPAPQTLFTGIKKLPGGTWLRVRPNGDIYEHRYWEPWKAVKPLTGLTETEIAEQVLAKLRESVALRKVSDVPVGVFLSGGIDSSTNTALFSEGEGQAVQTFSIGYEGEYASYQNELHFARLMADSVGADYHERLLGIDDLLDFLPRMVFLQDEPIADPVCVPVYYVSQLARENGVIVCQVGEGADELFWGYPTWKTALTLQHLNDWPMPRLSKQIALAFLGVAGKNQDFRYEKLRRAVAGQPIFWGGAEAFTQRQKEALLSPRLRQQFAGMSSWEAIAPIYERFHSQAWDPSWLHWMTFLDLNLRLPELLLMRVDKMSMGVGLETRVPFLDHEFVEMVLGIPAAMKTQNGQLKAVLKRAVRGLIPDQLIDRPKQGFGVPIYEWFFGRLGSTIREELKGFCQETDFLDWSAVETLINSGAGPEVWYLFNFALWWKEFIK